MVLLMVVTVGYLPIVLPLLLPGVMVNPAQIARSLVLLMLLPLGSALAVKANLPEIAAKVKPMFDKTSSLSLIALMALQTPVPKTATTLRTFNTARPIESASELITYFPRPPASAVVLAK